MTAGDLIFKFSIFQIDSFHQPYLHRFLHQSGGVFHIQFGEQVEPVCLHGIGAGRRPGKWRNDKDIIYG